MASAVRSAALLVILLGAAAIAQAQQPSKVARVGFLSASNPVSLGTRTEAFRHGIKELGYVEGKNLALEFRWADGKADRLRDLALELVRLKVDVIVTAGPSATRGARDATGTVPIVMAFDNDPVGSGFAASLARPGGNLTGLSILAPEVSGKQLELLKTIIPGMTRVAVLGDPKEPGNARALKQVERAASVLGVQYQYIERRKLKNLAALQEAVRGRADALIVLPSPLDRFELARAVLDTKLPAIYPWPEFVEAGGLMTYSVRMVDLYRRAASYVDRILKGAKPAELPIEQPTKFDFVINLKVARQIGLTIPPAVLSRADRVIE